jgi:3',5'-cyclic AMP phosphodiesterase CpdA
MVNTPNDVSISDFVRIKDAFAVPCCCVPGNHDVGGPATTNSLARYRQLVGPDYFPVRRPGCRFLMLDTQLFKWPLEGETAKQLAWLRAELADAKAGNEAVYVCVHIPLFLNSPDEAESWENLPTLSRLELLDLFRRHGVRAVLSGHEHRIMDNRDGGIRFVGGETTSTNFDGRPPGFRLWQISANSFSNSFVPLYRRKEVAPGPPPDPGSETGSVAMCRANLRFLDAVKEAAGMSGGLANGRTVSGEELSRWIKGGLASVKCPAGGEYRVNCLGEEPECSTAEHKLPNAYRFDEFSARAAAQKTFRSRMLTLGANMADHE